MSTARKARLLAHADASLKLVTRTIDWGALDRLAAFAAQRRAEMGEDRWQQLQAEWDQ